MNQITISNLKKMTVAEVKGSIPFEVIADGDVIAMMTDGKTSAPVVKEVIKEVKMSGMTQCPNCKMKYLVTPPSDKPFFFTMKHPPEG
jgi:hypothetical protein